MHRSHGHLIGNPGKRIYRSDAIGGPYKSNTFYRHNRSGYPVVAVFGGTDLQKSFLGSLMCIQYVPIQHWCWPIFSMLHHEWNTDNNATGTILMVVIGPNSNLQFQCWSWHIGHRASCPRFRYFLYSEFCLLLRCRSIENAQSSRSSYISRLCFSTWKRQLICFQCLYKMPFVEYGVQWL